MVLPNSPTTGAGGLGFTGTLVGRSHRWGGEGLGSGWQSVGAVVLGGDGRCAVRRSRLTREEGDRGKKERI
jgi:hypothetical protein